MIATTQLYKIISILLQYPSKDLVENWAELKQFSLDIPRLSIVDITGITGFIDWACSLPLIKLQAEYVNNFDITAENSLYLTYHLFDEQDRTRGPALIELAELYKSTGFEIGDGELPDYLPLILEYVSTMEEKDSAIAFLKQIALATDIIATNLEKNKNPYAPLVRMVVNHGQAVDTVA